MSNAPVAPVAPAQPTALEPLTYAYSTGLSLKIEST